MIASNVGPLQFLAGRAREMPDTSLAALETMGALAGLSIAWWIPSRIELALPFVALTMFGFWGIAEHARSLRDPLLPDAGSIALALLQRTAAIIGVASLAMTIFAAAGWAIGPVIS